MENHMFTRSCQNKYFWVISQRLSYFVCTSCHQDRQGNHSARRNTRGFHLKWHVLYLLWSLKGARIHSLILRTTATAHAHIAKPFYAPQPEWLHLYWETYLAHAAFQSVPGPTWDRSSGFRPWQGQGTCQELQILHRAQVHCRNDRG